MKTILIAACLLTASLVRAGTNELQRIVLSRTNAPTITISGEVGKILPGKDSIIPWQDGLTLEQIILTAGGLSDFAVRIELTDPAGNKREYDVHSQFRKDKAVRELGIGPNTVIRVKREVCP